MVRPLQEVPIDDVDADFQRDPGQNCQRNRRGQWGKGQHHHHQDQRSDNSRERRSPPRLDVHNGAHRGSSTRKTTEDTGGNVGQALTHKLLVGIVLRTGQAVCHHRGEQRINTTEHAQNSSIHKHQPQLTTGERGHMQRRQRCFKRRNRF